MKKNNGKNLNKLIFQEYLSKTVSNVQDYQKLFKKLLKVKNL